MPPVVMHPPVMPLHVTPPHVTLPRVTHLHATLRRVTPPHVTLRHRWQKNPLTQVGRSRGISPFTLHVEHLMAGRVGYRADS
jgi:hypothetical protein